MSQVRRGNWSDKVLALTFALAMLGTGGLLHLTHHLPGDEEFEAPWECAQCKIADHSIGDLEKPGAGFGPAFTRGFPTSWSEAKDPLAEDLESASPRGPPVHA